MCSFWLLPRQATTVPLPIGLGKAIELTDGEVLVNAPGIGRLGPDQVAVGPAKAVAAPRAVIAPTAATVASLVVGRLIIDDLTFVCLGCPPDGGAGQASVRSLSRLPVFPVTFLGSR